jgi:hypothetical protein
MTGQAHWITFIPLILGGLGIAWILFWEAKAARAYSLERRRFRCPKGPVEVDATLVREVRSGQAIGVRSCSAFANPEMVACDRACVAGFKSRPAPPQPEVRQERITLARLPAP